MCALICTCIISWPYVSWLFGCVYVWISLCLSFSLGDSIYLVYQTNECKGRGKLNATWLKNEHHRRLRVYILLLVFFCCCFCYRNSSMILVHVISFICSFGGILISCNGCHHATLFHSLFRLDVFFLCFR